MGQSMFPNPLEETFDICTDETIYIEASSITISLLFITNYASNSSFYVLMIKSKSVGSRDQRPNARRIPGRKHVVLARTDTKEKEGQVGPNQKWETGRRTGIEEEERRDNCSGHRWSRHPRWLAA